MIGDSHIVLGLQRRVSNLENQVHTLSQVNSLLQAQMKEMLGISEALANYAESINKRVTIAQTAKPATFHSMKEC